ncbi:MAG: endolytic transglycosylase MltG [Chitinophagales bacterium]|nr:endolytic transglycosylase MltG [Chitinophagales bacterium]
MARKKIKPFSKLKKVLIAFGIVLFLSLLLIGFDFYLKIYAPAITITNDDPYLYIPTGSSYENLLAIISQKKISHSIEDFDWVAGKMNLPSNVKPGKYRLQPRMSNYALAFLLRSGNQEPVKLVIKKFRLKADLVSFISKKLEVDSLVLITSLNDSVYLRNYSLKPDESMALFIPNTYEFKWNTSTEQFLQRMKREHDTFWNEQRLQKATALNLNTTQVTTLASIIEEETNYNPEKPRIAEVYLNRIKKGMLLQADPTVKFAMKNFEIKRIRFTHLSFVSPYNTYLNTGLPPGPICNPSIASIDAVLNAERGDYIYFCADPDKPGTHAFAKNYKQHQLNALRYQRWLNQR